MSEMAQLVKSTETFTCSDGFKMPGYLTRAGSLQRLPALVCVFDAFGCSSEMRRVADDFAAAGYAVFMPDLFSRGSWFSCIRTLMQEMQRGAGQSVDDLIAARHWLAQSEYVDAEHMGVIGFCLGGGFALLLANKGLFRVSAPFYGKAPDRLDGACPLIASYGGRDKMMLPEFQKLTAEVKRLKIPSDLKLYPDAGHSFMSKAPNPIIGLVSRFSRIHGAYNPEAAADANQRVLAFLRKHL
jgi:carboxymethylenebutenolidase